jgi:PIN domain nuclease of toxin-antitoxin system
VFWSTTVSPTLVRQHSQVILNQSISDLGTWWRHATELTSARVLHIRPTHITALASLPMLHKDPFDRILIAQAKAEGLDLVTNDAPSGEYPVQTIW